MISLVEQLQADALDQQTSSANLLRKAKLVASKLEVSETESWLDHELNGYNSTEDVPPYREVDGGIFFYNPYNGWCPVIMGDPHTAAKTSKRIITQSISSLEALLESDRSSKSLSLPVSGEAQRALMKQIGFECQFAFMFSSSQVTGILDSVRTRVLDWAMELEKNGVRGKGMSFSENEKKTATPATVFNYQIQNVGVIGNVENSRLKTHQAAENFSINEDKLEEFLSEIRKLRPQIEDDTYNEISPYIDEIEGELINKSRSPKTINNCLSSIKNVLENASGGIIASGIITYINKLI